MKRGRTKFWRARAACAEATFFYRAPGGGAARMTEFDPSAMEQRWQRAWDEARIFEPRREDGRPKFFIIFAYPGISGFLHVGHMRGYTYCDAIARYHRHLGENVLFPAGFHASGIPAVSFARRVERGDEATVALSLGREGCPSRATRRPDERFLRTKAKVGGGA